MTSPEGAKVDNAPQATAAAGAASPPSASALANGVNNNNNNNGNNANINQGNGGGGGGQALITQLLVRQQQGTLVDDPGGPPCPRASLACRPNSHPFQDRTLSLDQSAKIGRSVARARPAANNAIFDCKVGYEMPIRCSFLDFRFLLLSRCYQGTTPCCGTRMASSTCRWEKVR